MLAEDDEIFEVFLKPIPDSPFNVMIGEPSVSTGIIFDDDVPSKILYNLLPTSFLVYVCNTYMCILCLYYIHPVQTV